MSAVGLEVLLEGLIPEIAYSGEKGVSISELLKIVRRYHLSLAGQDASFQSEAMREDGVDGASLENSLSEAEMASARWAWDWLRSRPQILINGNKRWNRLDLDEVLALPEAEAIDPAIVSAPADTQGTGKAKGKKLSKALTTRPRIHPSEDLVWQTLTRHGVDYKRVPALEWACLQGIASARAEGILQSDLRRMVDQDKRSLPKRTDSLARKGYVAKRTVVVQKMKTSRLWLTDFAPPLVEADTPGLDLTPETLSKDLAPVPWHQRWTGDNIDMDALGRTVVGVVKAFNVIRYADLRSKMGVSGKRWQMKTLAKNCQRLVDIGVLRYAAASFPGSRKVFKDCLKFTRDPSAEEWDKFLATGKKTSQYSDPTRMREPKPNALALYGKSEDPVNGSGADRSKLKRIFSGWTPEKPLAQTVFEVIRSAGPEGASNPQVSVATVGYQHRRYLSSYLTKVAETQQPAHLKKFQVVSQLVRTGKTSAYMFSAAAPAEDAVSTETIPEETPAEQTLTEMPSGPTDTDPYGFGAVRPRAFGAGQEPSLSDMSRLARRSSRASKRKLLPRIRAERRPATEAVPEEAVPEAEEDVSMVDLPQEEQEGDGGKTRGSKRRFEETLDDDAKDAEAVAVEPSAEQDQDSSTPSAPIIPMDHTSTVASAGPSKLEDVILHVRYNGILGKLQVHRADRTVTFLRAGRGFKKPLIIPIDDNLDEPAIRDVPGSEEKSLVLATGTKDETPAWTYVFVFDDESHDNAILTQQAISEIKSPAEESAPIPTPQPATEEAVVAPEEATVEVAPTSKGTSSKGGARGKGKKGRSLPAGAKPYVCTQCGGAWKNDIGLKYHLEKALVPCNPNFDPALLLERSRKRRRLSPVPPASSAQSEAGGDEERPGRTRRSKSTRKTERKPHHLQLGVRTAMRAAQGPARKFRGLDVSDVGAGDGAASSISEHFKLASRAAASRMARPTKYASMGQSIDLGAGRFSGIELRPSTPTGTGSYPEPVPGVDEDALRYPPTAGELTGAMPGTQHAAPVLSSLPTAPATPQTTQAIDDATADFEGSSVKQRPHTPGYNSTRLLRDETPTRHGAQETSIPSESPAGALPGPIGSQYPESPAELEEQDAGLEEQDAGREEGADTVTSPDKPSIFKPFVPSTDYARISTDAKRRTTQAFDIILFLLDNTCGVFPGDRALFYALTKVFLEEFRNQMPPTWKNYNGAIKALETRKLAVAHTHMLKTERGRLQTCTLVIRTGVDPNGMIPSVMKQKMREAYPGLYIPPAFSPTQEELAVLQEMDKKATPSLAKDSKPNQNGEKFRSRRNKIEEIEVFNAPFYRKNAPSAKPTRYTVWVPEMNRLPDDGVVGPTQSTVDQFPEGHTQKKAPAASQDITYGDDIPVDPNIMGDEEPSVLEQPSVLEAIKTYSLLPPKPGKRNRAQGAATTNPLAKLAPEIGSAENPGLASLPGSFFSNVVDETTVQFAAPMVQFLDPITSFEDDDTAVAEGDENRIQDLSRENTQLVSDEPDQPAVGELQSDTETASAGPETFKFVCPSTLEPVSKRSWPDLSAGFFEYQGTSFTLKGWMPSQTWLLAQNLPFSAEEMVAQQQQQQQADKTIPRNWVDKEYARFCSTVNQCAAWEQSQAGTAVMLGGSVAPAYIYINVSAPIPRSNFKTPTFLEWLDETAYDLETLPYAKLQDDDYADVIYVESDSRERAEPAVKKRRVQQQHQHQHQHQQHKEGGGGSGVQGKRVQGRPPKLKLLPIKTMREHTAYPRSAEDFLRLPGEEEDEELDWSQENVRLAAFIVVTTLLGGVDRVVDWGLMLRLMPEQTISQLRHYWCALKKDRLSTIVSLTEKFRKAFLKAYENNEIPPIDFNNVLEYDWKALIKWTTKLDTSERRALPSTRERLDEAFTVSKIKHGNREWREAFFHPQRSMFNKFQDATSESLAFSLDEDEASEPKHSTDIVVAMSWTRSLCVTPVEAYTAEAVLQQRNRLFPGRSKTEITELMIKGVDLLQRQGIISKSSSKWSNGRRWRFNTRVLDSLEKAAQQDKFARAAAFKRELDAAFRAGERRKRVTYLTNDGMILALLNLQAHGRVRVETTGQPHVPMGHEPGNYETRKYTKKYMHFRLDIVPTETYLFDDVPDADANTTNTTTNNPSLTSEEEDEPAEDSNRDPALANLLTRLRTTHPPTRGPAGAVPVWCDVFGQVDPQRWLRYLSAVLITLASRGSMRPAELVKTLKPVVMVFEAEIVMAWLEGLGLLRAQIEGCAPALMEWWWLVVEAQREGLEKVRRGGEGKGEEVPVERAGVSGDEGVEKVGEEEEV